MTDKTHEQFMAHAIERCRTRLADGTGAYSLALVVKDGEVVAEGSNAVEATHDAAAHSELIAIREAGRKLGTWNLSGCDLYVTFEPCVLCVAAIWWAKIDRVFFGAQLPDAPEFGKAELQALSDEVLRPAGERDRPYTQVMGEEAFDMFIDWWERERPDAPWVAGDAAAS